MQVTGRAQASAAGRRFGQKMAAAQAQRPTYTISRQAMIVTSLTLMRG